MTDLDAAFAAYKRDPTLKRLSALRGDCRSFAALWLSHSITPPPRTKPAKR